MIKFHFGKILVEKAVKRGPRCIRVKCRGDKKADEIQNR